MTYKKLIQELLKRPSERLDDDVSIFVPILGEYLEIDSVMDAGLEQDVLDDGHIVIKLRE